MSFDVSAQAYGRFMGRFSEPLARQFGAYLDLAPGQRALDVGCGPGALTAVLVQTLGAETVAAIDPSPTFVAALRERLPGVEAHEGTVEHLPWPAKTFDRVAAQLVVHFMDDPLAGLREMARVARPGGTVAASVWDFDGGSGPLAVFWRAAQRVDPGVTGEAGRAGTADGQLADLMHRAGLHDVEHSSLTVAVDFGSFDEWWQPFTLGVGPAGSHLAALDDQQRAAVRAACAQELPDGPFTLAARAWTARGRA